LYSICFGSDGSSSPVSKADNIGDGKKLPGSVFNALPVCLADWIIRSFYIPSPSAILSVPDMALNDSQGWWVSDPHFIFPLSSTIKILYTFVFSRGIFILTELSFLSLLAEE
jgi:hypothetical protein